MTLDEYGPSFRDPSCTAFDAVDGSLQPGNIKAAIRRCEISGSYMNTLAEAEAAMDEAEQLASLGAPVSGGM